MAAMLYWPLVEFFKSAIENNNREEALIAARLLAPVKDELRIEFTDPDVDYSVENDDNPIGYSSSIHTMLTKNSNRKITSWVRQSRGGYCLDVNRMRSWAAVAADDPESRYALLMREVLEIIGLEDYAPQVPEPSAKELSKLEIKEI